MASKKNKFKEYVVCFTFEGKLEEKLREPRAPYEDIITKLERAPTLIVGAIPDRLDVSNNEFCVRVLNAGFTVQDMIDEFAKLGLHARLKDNGS